VTLLDRVSTPGHADRPAAVSVLYDHHGGPVTRWSVVSRRTVSVRQECTEIVSTFRERLDCRREVYENMTLRRPAAIDDCHCYPPCSDVTYDSTYSPLRHVHLSAACQSFGDRQLDLQPVDSAADHARTRHVLHAPRPVPAEHHLAGQTTTARRQRQRETDLHTGLAVNSSAVVQTNTRAFALYKTLRRKA